MSQITSTVTTKPQRSVTIDFDSNIVINGITNMIESDDKQIVATLGDKTLIITGEKLNVTSLDTARYVCTVSGSLITLKYVKGRQKTSLFKRIFNDIVSVAYSTLRIAGFLPARLDFRHNIYAELVFMRVFD